MLFSFNLVPSPASQKIRFLLTHPHKLALILTGVPEVNSEYFWTTSPGAPPTFSMNCAMGTARLLSAITCLSSRTNRCK